MRIRLSLVVTFSLCVALAAATLAARPAVAQSHAEKPSSAQHLAIPLSARMQPAELAAMIRSGKAPVILQVGFTTLYQEAHIQASIHAGPAVADNGMAMLRKEAEHLDRHKLLVIYCGCCPWPKCPNIRVAFDALRKMGFTDVKAVYIPHNFGTDWVEHGYPTTKGA